MSIIGKWNLIVDTPMGKQDSTLILNADGTGVTSSQLGSSDISDAKIDGDRATFSIEIEAMGQKTVLVGTASIDGDSITGKYESPMGASGFKGQRAT